ncbi:MAG: glucose 1-dehydrogenase, partial [Bacillota bacterium]
SIVTGAASGIGKAIAAAYAAEGSIVCLADIDERKGNIVKESICRNGGKALFIPADVSNSTDTDKVFSSVISQYGKVDILVNNAGMAYKATIEQLTEEQWDRQIDVNLKSVYLYSHKAIPIMAKQGGGVILNIASVTSLVGVVDFAAYCASKGAVLGITRAMALDHARQNIRVNCICPSGIKTELMAWQYSQAEDPIAEEQRVVDLHPIGRMAAPEEMAEMAIYLVSDKSSFVTGTAFSFDGGYIAK